MDWKQVVTRWRKMPASEQRRIRLARIPRRVARSMAFEGEPVDRKMLEAGLNSSHPTVRFIETTLGIQSHVELAPHIALRVLTLEADIADGRFSNRALGEDLILEFHQHICRDLVPGMAGRWRRVDVHVGDYEAPPHPHVPALMRDYCRDLEVRIATLAGTLDDRTLECLAFAEGRLLWIHPFEDFNGRLTRTFLVELLQRLDLPSLDRTLDPTWTPNAICKRSRPPIAPIGARWSRSGAGDSRRRPRREPSSRLPWPTANGVRCSGLECGIKRRINSHVPSPYDLDVGWVSRAVCGRGEYMIPIPILGCRIHKATDVKIDSSLTCLGSQPLGAASPIGRAHAAGGVGRC